MNAYAWLARTLKKRVAGAWLESDDADVAGIKARWMARALRNVEARCDFVDFAFAELVRRIVAVNRDWRAKGIRSPAGERWRERMRESWEDRPWARAKPLYVFDAESDAEAAACIVASVVLDPPRWPIPRERPTTGED